MKHTYEITGMTCDHCVQTVKTTLESIAGIQSVEMTLDPPQAVVTMHHHVTDEVMNEALKKAGNYQLKMAMGREPKTHKGHQHASADKTAETQKMQDDHSGHAQHAGHGGGENPSHGHMLSLIHI